MGDLEADFLTFPPKLLAIYIYNMYLCSILTLIYTTMAIIKNFWLKGSKKRLGGAVLYNAMGQTRAREVASEVSNPRTEAQMSQRIKWSNLVNFYRANASWMKYAFETKKTNQSEYNRFMSLNVSNSRIALTKQAAASGAAVADAYILTQGSLPSIEWSTSGTSYVSNIFTDGLDGITETTTVAAFASALINNNPAIQEGDQLSFIRVSQMVNSTSGYPYIIVRKYEVILDPKNSAYLNSYIPVEFLNSDNVGDNYTLNVLGSGRKGGFCMILSRTVGGRTYVSSQNLVIVNNADTIGEWSGAEANANAIASYGESSEAFLSSVSANTANNSPVGNSILSAVLDSRSYTPGQKVPTMDELASTGLSLSFSQDLTDKDELEQISILTTNQVTVQATGLSIGSGTAIGQIPEATEQTKEAHPLLITAVVNGVSYSIKFASSNVYTIEGLE